MMATIKDISNQTHLSISTISRILNDDTTLNVPVSTRNLVLQTAKELGYVKKKKKSQMKLGIISWISFEKEREDPYYLQIRQGVEDYCQKNNILAFHYYNGNIQHQAIDGLICIGKFDRQTLEDYRKVTPRLVLVDMYLDPIDTCQIVLDFRNTMKQIINQCHGTIAYLGGKEYTMTHDLYEDPRKKYFIKYTKEKGLDHCLILENHFTMDSGYQMTQTLIKNNQLPQILFCANDLIAIGALKALHDANIKVPDQVSLIGFDNIPTTNFTNPPLTSVLTPTFDMGQMAARIIYEAFQNKTHLSRMRISLPCFIVERESFILKHH